MTLTQFLTQDQGHMCLCPVLVSILGVLDPVPNTGPRSYMSMSSIGEYPRVSLTNTGPRSYMSMSSMESTRVDLDLLPSTGSR